MHRSLILIFFLITISFSVFSNESTPYKPELQRELIIIASEADINLNAHTASYVSEAQILNSLYEGLFSYNPVTLNPKNALIDSYAVSDDRLVWTFILKDKLMFSDGTKITAQSVRNSWLALIQTKNAPFASLLDSIVESEELRTGQSSDVDSFGVVVQDELTLKVLLKNPMAHLPQVLSHHAFAIVPSDSAVFSGAYILKTKTDTSIQLVRNPQYWDVQNVAIPSIRIDLSDDVEKNTYLFNVGKADWIIAETDLQSIFDPRTIRISEQFGTSYLFFKANGVLSNKTFRNALLAAVPWNELRAQENIPATTLVLPLPFFPKVDGITTYDLDLARTLLKKSGVDPSTTSITIDIPNIPYSIEKMEILKKAWEELGVETNIRPIPPRRYSTTIPSSDADVFSYIWIGDYADPTAFLELFKGNSTLNESNWKDSEYDDLLLDAAKTTDTVERYKKLAEAEKVLLESGIILPLSHTISLNVVDTALSGWYDNPLDVHPYKYLYFDIKKPLNNVAQLELE